MTLLCGICEQPVLDGEEIYVFVLTRFKELKSQVHWAIHPDIAWADKESIAHAECYECTKDLHDEEQ